MKWDSQVKKSLVFNQNWETEDIWPNFKGTSLLEEFENLQNIS